MIPQSVGNPNPAFFCLVIFDDRDERAPDGDPGAVQSVDEIDFSVAGAESRFHPSRLKIAAVAARGDFAISALPRQPDLQIVGFGGGESRVAGAKRDDAIRQFQFLQNRLGVIRHLFERLVGFARMDDLHEFHFFELMLAQHSARVFSGGAGLAPVARRMAGEFLRQRFFVDDFLRGEIGERDFGGRD